MVDDDSRKRLGRGLAALIGDMDPGDDPRSGVEQADRTVAIELLRPNPNNPRRLFPEEDLQGLARSIAEHGIVQPILVRSAGAPDGTHVIYEIIAGERRWRAAQLARVDKVPVIVRDVDDRQALELAIIENVQRADLNPVEEANGYQQLLDEYSYTQADLGNVIGKSRSHVANTLRLLSLPEAIRAMVASGALSAGHARTLVTAEDPEGLARRIVSGGLSVRQAERLAQKPDAPAQEKPASAVSSAGNTDNKDADTLALERGLSDALGLNVLITHKQAGSGDLNVKYASLEQLDDLCRRLLG